MGVLSRLGVTIALWLVAGCAQTPPAPLETCRLLYQSFSTELQLAIEARRSADPLGALYHSDGAQMNLDVLLERDCCRFSDTCPAMIQL